MLGIVASRADPASMRIKDELLAQADWESRTDTTTPNDAGGGTWYYTAGVELRVFDELHIYLDEVTKPFNDLDILMFASRHSGDTDALLTAHYTGNFGPADYGGNPGQLARACPNAHAALVASLTSEAPDEYSVGIECTHHGPTDVDVPSMFVEIGSGPSQWQDPAAARAVARAILSLRQNISPDTDRTIVGFGGGHYAPRFERILLETDWALGHIGADWALDAVEDDASPVIESAFTASNASMAVIDGDYPDLQDQIEALGYQIVSETFVRETTGVPLAHVNALERDLSPIADGLRFGDNAATLESPEIYSPDLALLSELNGIDQDQVRATVAELAVAFETSDNGNRVTGRIALPENLLSNLQEAFIDILSEEYDEIERHDGTITVRVRWFDPDAANTLGIPEGPVYGRLARGEAVEVNGEVIDPEAVHSEETRQYHL